MTSEDEADVTGAHIASSARATLMKRARIQDKVPDSDAASTSASQAATQVHHRDSEDSLDFTILI